MLKSNKSIDVVKSLDAVLKNVFLKIKKNDDDNNYLKLVELLFKGIDLRQKLSNKENKIDEVRQLPLINGIDLNQI